MYPKLKIFVLLPGWIAALGRLIAISSVKPNNSSSVLLLNG
jgi:hypothetical protein